MWEKACENKHAREKSTAALLHITFNKHRPSRARRLGLDYAARALLLLLLRPGTTLLDHVFPRQATLAAGRANRLGVDLVAQEREEGADAGALAPLVEGYGAVVLGGRLVIAALLVAVLRMRPVTGLPALLLLILCWSRGGGRWSVGCLWLLGTYNSRYRSHHDTCTNCLRRRIFFSNIRHFIHSIPYSYSYCTAKTWPWILTQDETFTRCQPPIVVYRLESLAENLHK
jgi:hypothetical protein